MRKKVPFLLLLVSSYQLVLPSLVSAVCPVCTIAVVGGLGLSRYLGIDDTISGLWVGALILSSSLWFTDWLEKRYHYKEKHLFAKKYLDDLVILTMYLLVLLPLARLDIINHPLNKIFGIDKLVFGTVIGSLVFLLGVWADKKVRKIKGKQLMQYQKVVFPVSLLVLASVITYFLVK
jgi:hypothetical protein